MDPDEYMPGIPCHPVGYGIAVQIMRYMAHLLNFSTIFLTILYIKCFNKTLP